MPAMMGVAGLTISSKQSLDRVSVTFSIMNTSTMKGKTQIQPIKQSCCSW